MDAGLWIAHSMSTSDFFVNLFKQREAELYKTGYGEAANTEQTAAKIKLRQSVECMPPSHHGAEVWGADIWSTELQDGKLVITNLNFHQL